MTPTARGQKVPRVSSCCRWFRRLVRSLTDVIRDQEGAGCDVTLYTRLEEYFRKINAYPSYITPRPRHVTNTVGYNPSYYTGDIVYHTGDHVYHTGDRMYHSGNHINHSGDRMYYSGNHVNHSVDRMYHSGNHINHSVDRMYHSGNHINHSGDRMYHSTYNTNKTGPTIYCTDPTYHKEYQTYSPINTMYHADNIKYHRHHSLYHPDHTLYHHDHTLYHPDHTLYHPHHTLYHTNEHSTYHPQQTSRGHTFPLRGYVSRPLSRWTQREYVMSWTYGSSRPSKPRGVAAVWCGSNAGSRSISWYDDECGDTYYYGKDLRAGMLGAREHRYRDRF